MLLTIAKDITNDLKLLNEVEILEERHKILYEIMDLYIDARQLSKMSRFSFMRKK